MQDDNKHSPLHISSYFGDFKASRMMKKAGAEASSAAYEQQPLEVGKNQFARCVL
jgi:ankyrin repeat protein